MSLSENVKSILRIFKRSGVDKSLYFATFLLAIFGIYMIADASVGSTIRLGPKFVFVNLFKQLFFVSIGTVALFVAAKGMNKKLGMNNLNKCKLYYGIALIALFACRLWNINGSHAWIVLGPVTIQPAEFMKIILVFVLAYTLGELPKRYKISKYISPRKRRELLRIKKRDCLYWPVGMVLGATATIIVIQKDFGSAAILLAMCFVVFLCAPDPYYRPYKKMAIMAAAVGVVVIAVGSTFIFRSHQLQRIVTWKDPLNEKYIYSKAMQVINGLIAFTNGGLIGRGAGNSVMKFGYIPEAQNDYISAIVAEEFGFFGILIIIVLYCYIIFKLFNYAQKIKNDKYKLILVGIASYFFMHMIVNLGGVSGYIPMTGVPLLLISAGGTSTVVAMYSIGAAQRVISIYNKDKLKREAEESL